MVTFHRHKGTDSQRLLYKDLKGKPVIEDLIISAVAGEDLAVRETVYLSTGGLTATKREENTTGAWASDIFGARWAAQTFQLNIHGTIPKVNLMLKKVLSPTGNVQVDLYAVDGNDEPTGASLGTVTKAASSLQTSFSLEEFVFSSPIAVNPDTTYIIVCKAVDADQTNKINWAAANSGNPYANGEWVYSQDSGSSWNHESTYDFKFNVYARETSGYVYKTDASYNDERIFRYLGFTMEAKKAGEIVKIRTGGIQDNLSGLTILNDYYLSDTAGEISSSSGTYIKRVGIAVNTTSILILKHPVLGGWETKANNTEYQADRDGFVSAWFTGNAEGTVPRVSSVYIGGYSDESSPVATLRTQNAAYYYNGVTGTLSCGISFPVKKGDYWKVVGSRGGGVSETSGIYFIPLN